jgi:von Willebrand factor type A domain
MYHPHPPAHRKVIAAAAFSALLHAALGLCWWATHDRNAVAAGSTLGTAVDGPHDGETFFVLRDPPARRPPPGPTVLAPWTTERPATLPPSVTGPGPQPPDPGARTQSGISPAGHDSLPKSGGPTPLHGRQKPGRSVVYVLDHSSSMSLDGLLPRAVAAIKASLDQLGPDVRFRVVAYNRTATALAPNFVPATPENVGRAVAWLDQLRAEGGSNHVAGMREGLWLRPEAIFLLTDADDLDETEVRAIAKLIRTPVSLSMAIFGGRHRAADTPLERLVRQCGGTVQYIPR